MAARTASQALGAALAESLRPTRSYEGYCLRAVRELLGVAAQHPTALAAWEAVPDRERFRSAPPPGVPVWWEVGQHGHVALALGFGVCWSTDIRRAGRLDVVPLVEIERRWGARYLGWSHLLNGVRVPRV